MKSKLVFSLFLLLLLTSFAVAQTDEFVYKQGTEVDIKVPCTFLGQYCGVTSSCNLTLLDPEDNVILSDALMTRNSDFHNYTLNTSDTAINGEYTRNVQCCEASLCGFSTHKITITPTGEKLTTSSAIGYGIMLAIMFGVCIFFLVFSRMTENPGVKLFFIMVGFVVMLMTIGTGVVTAQNFDIQSNAINLVSGLLYLIIMIFTVSMMYIFIQQTRRAIQLLKAKKGFVDEDDIGF